MISGQNRNNGSNEIPYSLHSGFVGDGTNIPVNVDYDYCIFMFQNKDMTLAPILLFSNQPLTLNGSCVISSICILTSSAQACILAHPWDCLAYYLTQYIERSRLVTFEHLLLPFSLAQMCLEFL